jgi:hypothetical protein
MKISENSNNIGNFSLNGFKYAGLPKEPSLSVRKDREDTKVYIGAKSKKLKAQFLLNWNEYVKTLHYQPILGLNADTADEIICGLRYPKLTLCDPTLPHAKDIQKMIKIYAAPNAKMWLGQPLLTLELDATLQT